MEIRPGRRRNVGMAMGLDRLIHSRKAGRGFRAAPYGHRELSAGTKNAARLCKGASLIRDMAHAQIRHHDVKSGVVKGKVLCVRFNEGCLRYSLPCQHKHWRGKIDANDLTAAAQQRLGNVALPTTQVERLLMTNSPSGA